jgi:hypothetical protein
MDAVLGWNLVLSRPVILAIAWLVGVCHPGIEDRAAPFKACRTTPSWWRFSHSVEAAEHERELADDDHGLMGQWGLLYWRVRRRQRYIQAKGWMIKPPLGLIPPTIWIVNRRILLTACTTLPV